MGSDTGRAERIEWQKCKRSKSYFIHTYVQLFNATEQVWLPFQLWPAQRRVVADLQAHRQIALLKARQLGMTWLCLAHVLHEMLFRPAATALLFSRRDTEAIELLSDEKLRGMYSRLPRWMQARWIVTDNSHEWGLSNGSRALAFPTTAGDSYTANVVIVDEADLVPDLNRLMRSVKPTIDNGGQIILLSRSDKERPSSEFKQIYRGAKSGESDWHPIFLSWRAHPGRTDEWYAKQKVDCYTRTAGYDDLYEQYPESDDQALAPRQKDKRIAYDGIVAVAGVVETRVETQDFASVRTAAGPAITGLRGFEVPQLGRRYVIGADPAEGNPDSDDSAACVLDAETNAQVAVLSGKLGITTFAHDLHLLARYYHNASVLVERNNHGHAVLLALEIYGDMSIVLGLDGRPGWWSNAKGKTLMYDLAADTIRAGNTIIYDEKTREQLASIEANTLLAPAGLHDDCADAYALALVVTRYGQMSSMA